MASSHFHTYNGKRRCITPRMSIDQHQTLRDVHRAARTSTPHAFAPDHEVLYVGVQFHFLTPNQKATPRDVMDKAHDIIHMMNAGFSHLISPLHNLHKIEHGDFLQDSHNRKIYHQHKKLAGSPNIHFLMVGPPELKYIPYAHKHTGTDSADMDYWDNLAKVQVAPARDPVSYYHIWVIGGIKSVLLGYGNFPKVNPTSEDLAMDGFVYFLSPAPYDMHATAVHESGHVFGLNHVFNHDEKSGCYDDGIDDTPPQNAPDFGPVWFRSNKWPSSMSLPNGHKAYHNISNFMNYVDDNCMFMFTVGQCRKMRDTLQTVRSSWILSQSQVDALRNPWSSSRLKMDTEADQKQQQPQNDQVESLNKPGNNTVNANIPRNSVTAAAARNKSNKSDEIDMNPVTEDDKSTKIEESPKSLSSEIKTNNLKTLDPPFAFKRQRKFVSAPHQKPKHSDLASPMYDLYSSLVKNTTSISKTIDTTGKFFSALSFACC